MPDRRNFRRKLHEALGALGGGASYVHTLSKPDSYVQLDAYPGGSYLTAVVNKEVDTSLGQPPPAGWRGDTKEVESNELKTLIDKAGLHFNLSEFLRGGALH